MPRIKDFMVQMSPEAWSASLVERASQFETRADALWRRDELKDGSRVYPAILRCTARQLRILARSADMPIEVAALACRITFETNIRARLSVADHGYLLRFQQEFVGDEVDLLNGWLELAEPDSPNAWRADMHERLAEISAIMERRKLKSLKATSIHDASVQAGVFKEYRSMYKFYSKYVHASGWLLLASDERRDGEAFRMMLAVMTQYYAADTLALVLDATDAPSKDAAGAA